MPAHLGFAPDLVQLLIVVCWLCSAGFGRDFFLLFLGQRFEPLKGLGQLLFRWHQANAEDINAPTEDES